MRRIVIGAGWLWGLAARPSVVSDAVDTPEAAMLVFTGAVIGLAWLKYSALNPSIFRKPLARWLWLSVPVILLGSVVSTFIHCENGSCRPKPMSGPFDRITD